jgi:hypothetical protein
MSADAEADDGDTDVGQDGCCVPEGEMLVVRNLNLDYPWKGGNQYARVCPECESQTFTAKSYWQMRLSNDEMDAHVVPKGEDERRLAFPCPYGASDEFDIECDGFVWVGCDECESCGEDIEWED